MSRRRILALAAGTGLLLTTLPARAAVDPDLGGSAPSAGALAEQEALALLAQAAHAGRWLTYTGTQYVASWRGDSTETALVELRHDPSHGSVLVAGTDGDDAAGSVNAVLDPRMLQLLGASYDVQVAGDGRCAGRRAAVIEARRDGDVAGRFWVDRDSGMLLRREVFDRDGGRIRSMAFLDLALLPQQRSAPAVAVAAATGSERPSSAALERWRRRGWHVPEQLPDGFRLFETRFDGAVLHLAYTDGLSTLSLFAQNGELGSEPMEGFAPEQVGGRPVWVRGAAPERVVWAGGGRVWTLVSDASRSSVRAVVESLPREQAPDSGVLARFGRGLSRLGSLVNPF